MQFQGGQLASKVSGMVTAGVVYIMICLYAWNHISAALLLMIPLALLVGFPVFSGPILEFKSKLIRLGGIIYISIPFALLNLTAFLPGSFDPLPVLFLLLLVWINDTMAYVVGSSIGKHKMAPRISPKKTWEGLTGGILSTLVAAFLISELSTALSRTDILVMAVIVGVFGTLGDLFESYLKRNLGIDDSGKSMPGHGGLLDRFDGFIFAIPVIYLYLQTIN